MAELPTHPLIAVSDPETTAGRIRDLLSLVSFVHAQGLEAEGTSLPGPGLHAACLTALQIVDGAVRWLGEQEYCGNVTLLEGQA